MILAIHVSFAALTSLKYSGIQEKIKKLVGATAYPGRADNTRKTLFLGLLFYIYVQFMRLFLSNHINHNFCLPKYTEGPPHFLEDFLISS